MNRSTQKVNSGWLTDLISQSIVENMKDITGVLKLTLSKKIDKVLSYNTLFLFFNEKRMCCMQPALH